MFSLSLLSNTSELDNNFEHRSLTCKFIPVPQKKKEKKVWNSMAIFSKVPVSKHIYTQNFHKLVVQVGEVNGSYFGTFEVKWNFSHFIWTLKE